MVSPTRHIAESHVEWCAKWTQFGAGDLVAIETMTTDQSGAWQRWRRRRFDEAIGPSEVMSNGLPRLAALLGTAVGLDEIAATASDALRPIDAIGAAIAVVDRHGEIVEVATTGASDIVRAQLGPLVIDGRFPIHVALTSEPMWFGSRDRAQWHFPAFSSLPAHWEAYAAAALRIGSELVGSIAIPFGSRRRFSPIERSCIEAVYALVAHAVVQRHEYQQMPTEAAISPLVSGLDDGVVVVDETIDRIVYANAAVETITGLDCRTLLTTPCTELRRRFDCADTDPPPLGTGTTPGIHRCSLRAIGGQHHELEIHNAQVDVSGRRISVILDITESEHSTMARVQSVAQEMLWHERERVARDLHDGAVQSVFATSLALAAAASRAPTEMRNEIEHAIDGLDVVIKQLRTTVFDLRPLDTEGSTVRRIVESIVGNATRALGFRPTIGFLGPVDDIDDPAVLVQITFALREMLANVARHAHARSVEITITADTSTISASVTDDGDGFAADAARGDGLSNLERRAAELGGSCAITSSAGCGTTVRWSIRRTTAPTSGEPAAPAGSPPPPARRHQVIARPETPATSRRGRRVSPGNGPRR